METRIQSGGLRLHWDSFRAILSKKFPTMGSLRYVGEMGDRDLRIDFLRGMAMTVLLIVHFEFFSWYNLLVWERIGLISGAGAFVLLSGIVIGMVYRRRVEQDGFKPAAFKLLDRAFQLYKVNLFILFSVFLLSKIPGLDTHLLTTYTDELTGEVYKLFPDPETPWLFAIGHFFLLKASPHYTQILGLYVAVLLAAPLALWLMQNGKTGVMIGLSLVLYFVYQAYPSMPTGAQFEYGFPLLAWQVYFFLGMAAGFHREKIAKIMSVPMGKVIIFFAVTAFLGFLFLAQNSTNPNWPEWSKLSIIPRETFDAIYSQWFLKDELRPGRIVNLVAALTVGYWLLTKYWRAVEPTLGRFFVPLGQASLYIFVVHIYLILLLSNLGIVNQGNQYLAINEGNPWVNTVIHTAVLALIWYMVKKKFLFNIVPR